MAIPIPSGRELLLRRLFIVGVTGLVLGLVTQISLANALSGTAPAMALRIDPGNAVAAARRGEQLAIPGAKPEQLEQARRLAEEALSRDPTNAPAARVLGTVESLQGQAPRALASMTYAAAMSKRDLPAQVWLIEEAVSRNDVRGALDHFDTALRSSYNAASILFPILVSATEDPALVPEIAAVLAKRPWWGDGYAINLASNGKALHNAAELFMLLDRRAVPVPVDAKNALVVRLAEAGEFDTAWQLYARDEPSARRGGVQLGRFERDSRPIPFEWRLANDANLVAERVPTGKETALAFRADAGVGGEVIRQLLLLRPGRYRLSFVTQGNGRNGGTRPYWSLVCAGANQPTAVVSLPSTGDAAVRTTGEITVPAQGCGAQWLLLTVRASEEIGGVEGRVSDIRIEPFAQPALRSQSTK